MNKNAHHREGTPIRWIVRPFQEFAKLDASDGILLIGCTVVALAWANSPWAASYFQLWHIDVTSGFAGPHLSESLHFWINDGLMALFFLLVGLEIKRETLVGELASFRKAALPIAAAIGGMLIPAGMYALLNHSGPGANGWGVPMATDIAFALGVLALLGDRIPISLRIFLAALAIADDIGAVLVIAIFYAAKISGIHLAVAGLFFAALIVANRAGARQPWIYVLLGIGLWASFLHSGIHATVSGVLLAIAIPSRQRLIGPAFISRSEGIVAEFRSAENQDDALEAGATEGAALQELTGGRTLVESPMLRFEHALTPWTKHLVMPLFALANAGVTLSAGAARELVHSISLGIICGLVLGKPIGIVGFSWLATRSGIATLPIQVGWRQVFGVGLLGGIGFTMSLFIANLAFGPTAVLDTAKIGILAASIASGLAGAILLFRRTPAHSAGG